MFWGGFVNWLIGMDFILVVILLFKLVGICFMMVLGGGSGVEFCYCFFVYYLVKCLMWVSGIGGMIVFIVSNLGDELNNDVVWVLVEYCKMFYGFSLGDIVLIMILDGGDVNFLIDYIVFIVVIIGFMILVNIYIMFDFKLVSGIVILGVNFVIGVIFNFVIICNMGGKVF